jgi:(2Fe-2S) ferredoxin
MPKRAHYLFVCTNRRPEGHPKGSCATSGAEAVHAAIKDALAKRGLAKSVARACTSSCLDVCHRGVAIAIEPDGVFYGGVTLADVDEIVASLEAGTIVDRLVVADDDYDDRRKPAAT